MRAGAFLAPLLLLAGCSESASPGGSGNPSASTGLEEGLEAPTWDVGDWWNFTGPFGGFDYVVSAADGEDYTIDTAQAGLAWFDAQFDVSTMGPVRKSDLAGSQGSTRVQFFDFPLLDNKTWPMMFDEGQGGGQLTVTAKRLDAEAYEMTARFPNGTAYVSYVYDNETEWFRELDFKDAEGNSAFKVTLARRGENFSGPLTRWSYVTEVDIEGELSTVTTALDQYDVPLTATDVYVDVEVHCVSGSGGAGTAPSPFVGSAAGTDERGAGDAGPCPLDQSFHGSAGPVQAPPGGGDAETWGRVLMGGAGTVGTYEFAIYIRTATEFQAGQAPR